MEMAESLVKSGLEITILEILPEILPILDEDMGILVVVTARVRESISG